MNNFQNKISSDELYILEYYFLKTLANSFIPFFFKNIQHDFNIKRIEPLKQ